MRANSCKPHDAHHTARCVADQIMDDICSLMGNHVCR